MNTDNNKGAQTYSSATLIRRYWPYLAKYKKLLFLDLFFAGLTTLCDIVLPMIMRQLTTAAPTFICLEKGEL